MEKKTIFNIADKVKDNVWETEGIINAVYDHYKDAAEEFISMSADSWLQHQLVPYTKEQIENETWYSILCDAGGSILTCESRLEMVKQFKY